jgi:hypothetical protein
MLGFLLMLWFDNQAVALPNRPDLLLYPAELVCLAVRDLPPQGLWWDFDSAGDLKFVDMDLEAVIFPPMRLRRWDQFTLEMPGDVALFVGITDPRFDRRGSSPHAWAPIGATSADSLDSKPTLLVA